jgi:thiol-disulfide isomerase/thioredoxin/YHS domain-containing protein
MNLSKFLPTLLGGLLSVTLANFGFAKDSSEIAWSEDLVATMELAQRTGKPVLVHFYGDHCPPCRMLEKKAFKDPQLIQAIGEHVLAVRINAERDTKIAARFRVNRWPTDVYLHPNGDEIYRNISAQDPAAYERTVMKVAEKNQRLIGQLKTKPFEPTRSDLMAAELKAAELKAAELKAAVPANEAMESNKDVRVSLASSQSTMAPASSPVVASLKGPARVRLSEAAISSVDTADVAINYQRPLPSPPSVSLQDQQSLVVEAPVPSVEVPSVEVPLPAAPSLPQTTEPQTTEPQTTEPQTAEPQTTEPQTTEQIAQPTKVEPSLPTAVAMGGFCPVSLAMAIEASKTGATSSPAWVQGHGDFAVRHRGRVYHCVSEEALSKFLESPDLYAPVLSGCDLVEYSKSGKWIDGDCRFGFIDKETGRIFLFSSSLNCQEFAQNCESYSSMVGKPAQR